MWQVLLWKLHFGSRTDTERNIKEKYRLHLSAKSTFQQREIYPNFVAIMKPLIFSTDFKFTFDSLQLCISFLNKSWSTWVVSSFLDFMSRRMHLLMNLNLYFLFCSHGSGLPHVNWLTLPFIVYWYALLVVSVCKFLFLFLFLSVSVGIVRSPAWKKVTTYIVSRVCFLWRSRYFVQSVKVRSQIFNVKVSNVEIWCCLSSRPFGVVTWDYAISFSPVKTQQ